MTAYIQEQRQTPVRDRCQVLVAGGGYAGVSAALAAARGGADVLLLEREYMLGGLGTAGLITIYLPLCDGMGRQVSFGIAEELLRLCVRNGLEGELPEAWFRAASVEERKNGPRFMARYNPQLCALELERLLLDAGVRLLYGTSVCDVVKDGARIASVLVENKSGRSAITAGCVIDCTGDGDVAARAGAPFRIGRDADGAVQPMSLMFKLGEMDYVQAMDYSAGPLKTTDLFFHMEHAAQAAGLKDYAFNFDRPYILTLPTPHQGIAEMTHVRGKSALDARQLSDAELEGRELVHEAMTFFTSYMPQFRHAILEQTAPTIGIRESRRILGEYELTLDDLLTGRRQPDGVCECAFNVDIHQPDGLSQEGYEYRVHPYHIPYRCLLPKQVEGLLVAGRCISGSYEAHASYRVTGDCVAMGQAAGTAAALAAAGGVTPRALNASELVQALRADGVRNLDH